MNEDDEIIGASEVGQHAYCARAWWMARVLGYRSANVAELGEGRVGHRAHGRRVERAQLLRWLALGLLLLAGLAFAAWLSLTLLG